MEIYFILALMFLGISILIWVILVYGIQGYDRYRKVFTERTETQLESLFLFVDAKKMFILNMVMLLAIPVSIYFITGTLFYVVMSIIALLIMPKLLLCSCNLELRGCCMKSGNYSPRPHKFPPKTKNRPKSQYL